MVENENAEDPTEENITFLYTLAPGAALKSYGFYTAKVAGIGVDVNSLQRSSIFECFAFPDCSPSVCRLENVDGTFDVIRVRQSKNVEKEGDNVENGKKTPKFFGYKNDLKIFSKISVPGLFKTIACHWPVNNCCLRIADYCFSLLLKFTLFDFYFKLMFYWFFVD